MHLEKARQQHARGIRQVGPGAALNLREIALADGFSQFLLHQPRQFDLRQFAVEAAEGAFYFP